MTKRITGFSREVIQDLRNGGVVVLRTDTLYGIVARADNEAAVERVYNVKGRTLSKSPIVLIASLEQMFDEYGPDELARLSSLWPGKNSIILQSTTAPAWIVRDNESVAYRQPDDLALRQLLAETGPLIAPSANPEGSPPAIDIDQAEAYFGGLVDVYVDGGTVTDETPSRLYRMQDTGLERLR